VVVYVPKFRKIYSFGDAHTPALMWVKFGVKESLDSKPSFTSSLQRIAAAGRKTSRSSTQIPATCLAHILPVKNNEKELKVKPVI